MKKILLFSGILVSVFVFLFLIANKVFASYHFSNYKGRPPIHVLGGATKNPSGLTPSQIKSFYNLPSSGGVGTIVIVGAYDDQTIEKDLNLFSTQFNLPACTTANGCFTKHKMATVIKSDSGWAMEISLDTEWAHAIAPNAKIMLVEAVTPSGANLLKAVDYAADVAFDANPASGFSIERNGKWYVVGGTSAGAPQWAAIAALGSGINLNNLYTDKNGDNNGKYFRDITSGSNGDCGYYCSARKHYDYVTGLGSPLTDNF